VIRLAIVLPSVSWLARLTGSQINHLGLILTPMTCVSAQSDARLRKNLMDIPRW
jgi:hypothetical protein